MSARILLYGLFFISFQLNARGPIAKVIKVKGKVTQLRPGAIHPSKLKTDDVLYEDASIVTSKNSFVRIQFMDNTVVNLGPEGMVRLEEHRPKSPGVLSLLKGKIRAKIVKEEPKRDKFFVRTRTAAMGVRGTDFQSTYNPKSKNTSTLTFTGEVAMAKLSEDEERKQVLKKFKKLNIERPSVTRAGTTADIEVEVEEETAAVELGPTESLAHILQTEEATSVKNGQFSGTYENLEKVSEPVKINPVQLTTLYRNEDLVMKKGRRKIEAADVNDLDSKGLLAQAEQEAPPEGYFDKSTGSFAPKAGGLIDIETGIYIPPGKDAEYDPGKKIFKAPTVGSIDRETGQYVPPKGLKLDPKKGFVVTSKMNKGKLLAMRDQLNTDIMQDVLLEDTATESQTEFKQISQKEGFVKDRVHFDFYVLSQELEYSDDVINGAKKIESSGGHGLGLTWSLASGTKWQPFIGIGMKKIEIGNATAQGFTQGSNTYFRMLVGARFFLYPRFNLMARALIDQNPFLDYVSSGNQVNRITLTKLQAVVEAMAWEKDRFALMGEGILQFNPSKERGNFKVRAGMGLGLAAKLRYYLGHKYFLQLAPGFNLEKYKVKSTSLDASALRTQFQLALTLGGLF